MPNPDALTPERRLTDLLTEVPNAGDVFAALELDACCGERTLGGAAESAGLELQDLVELLADGDASALRAPHTPSDLDGATLRRQVEFIVNVHHRYARRALLRAHRLVLRAWSAHRGSASYLGEVRTLIQEITDDLMPHMAREERFLFPYCISLEEGISRDARIHIPLHGNLDYPLVSIRHDHSDDTRRLSELRRLTGDYDPPADGCPCIRALLDHLAQLERALQQHIRIEDDVLFPRAVERERAARTRSASGAS
ncbi:MAG: hemerythrin domain-containing protein [Thermoanaerobaculia bacterium]